MELLICVLISANVTLKYNHELLRKDKDEDVSQETEAIREAKKFAVKMAMESKEFIEDEELDFEDFKRVIKKIKRDNKNVYRDLIQARKEFQYSVFKFYCLCYRKEVMPEFFNLFWVGDQQKVKDQLTSHF